jgi:hypothetical protein
MLIAVGNVPVRYSPLSDMNLSKGNTQNIETNIYPVAYRVYSYANVDNQTERRLGVLLSESTRLLKQYATINNLPISDCMGNQVLEFYIVPYSVLNDRSRFFKWVVEAGPGSESSNIVAHYSPRREESLVDSITITPDSVNKDYVMAHEISHYWYERLCWSRHSSMSTEPFAVDFEKYFIAHIASNEYRGGSVEYPENETYYPLFKSGAQIERNNNILEYPENETYYPLRR